MKTIEGEEAELGASAAMALSRNTIPGRRARSPGHPGAAGEGLPRANFALPFIVVVVDEVGDDAA